MQRSSLIAISRADPVAPSDLDIGAPLAVSWNLDRSVRSDGTRNAKVSLHCLRAIAGFGKMFANRTKLNALWAWTLACLLLFGPVVPHSHADSDNDHHVDPCGHEQSPENEREFSGVCILCLYLQSAETGHFQPMAEFAIDLVGSFADSRVAETFFVSRRYRTASARAPPAS